MKMVLEKKDREKPWYRGMSNMTDEEIENYWKDQLKAFAILVGMLVVMGIVYILTIYFGSGLETEEEKEKGIAAVVCFICGIMIAEAGGLAGISRRKRLLKDEREESE